jgi:hypothetical protein
VYNVFETKGYKMTETFKVHLIEDGPVNMIVLNSGVSKYFEGKNIPIEISKFKSVEEYYDKFSKGDIPKPTLLITDNQTGDGMKGAELLVKLENENFAKVLWSDDKDINKYRVDKAFEKAIINPKQQKPEDIKYMIEEAFRTAEISLQDSARPLEKIKEILIIDDMDDNVFMNKMAITRGGLVAEGYAIKTYDTVDKALAYLKDLEKKGQISAGIVTDNQTGVGAEGLDLLDYTKGKGIGVLLVSADDRLDVGMIKARGGESAQYLNKADALKGAGEYMEKIPQLLKRSMGEALIENNLGGQKSGGRLL